MIDFVIFAVTFVTVLVITVFYLYPGTRKTGTTVPGLDPSDPKEGNLPDIALVGNFHGFLVNLHKEHGPIASFWMGTQLVISLASPELFQQHQHVFDRPGDIFNVLKQGIGEDSLFFLNGTPGRQRHKIFIDYFSSISKDDKLISTVANLAKELVHKLSTLPKDQHIPLQQYMMALALKSLFIPLFGKFFEDDKVIVNFRKNYEVLFTDMELKSTGQEMKADSAKEKAVKEALATVRNILSESLKNKVEGNSIQNMLKNLKISEDSQVSDLLSIIQQGFHPLGSLLTWTLYFIATHNDVQHKVQKEISEHIDKDDISYENLNKLKYMRWIINESLRLTCVMAYTARYQDMDIEIGGHIIPKNTPIIHEIGIVLQDDQYWPLHDKFDPDRFAEATSESRHALAFKPWGFAGKRTCPGENFAFTLVQTILVIILRKFQVKLVEGQVVRPVYSLNTKPLDEIWITVKNLQE